MGGSVGHLAPTTSLKLMGAGYFDLEDWESNEAIFVDDSHGMRVIVKPPKGFVMET